MTNVVKTLRKDSFINIKTSSLIRILDVVASGLGLLFLAPIFGLIGFFIKVTSGGPVFCSAKRIGKDGQSFKMFKFRTMYLNTDQRGPASILQHDPRLTPVGRFLRRTKLDKLPQLINVLRGEMSLVGPRPEDPRYVAWYTPEQRRVLAVRPGLTSPATILYREKKTFLGGDDWETVYREEVLPRKLTLDLNYLQQRTVWTDLVLIMKTIHTIIWRGDYFSAILQVRNRYLLIVDILALLLIPTLALTLRLDRFNWWPDVGPALVLFTLVALLVKLPIFYKMGLYHRYWRYAGVNDLTRVAISVGLSTTGVLVIFWAANASLTQYSLAIYRTVPVIDGLLTFLAIGGFRFGLRGLYYWYRQFRDVANGQRVLVVGAGEAGKIVAREIQTNPQLNLELVGFVDDDLVKVNSYVAGLPVLGTTQHISRLIGQFNFQKIIVAIPSAPLARQQEIIVLCQKNGIGTYNLPGIYQLLAGHKTLSRSPRIDINRLLGREPVKTDQTEVAAILEGATVLVTGAGGSIGSELCRQIARFNPAELILLGHGENSIFEISLDLRLSFPKLVTQSAIVDVRDHARVNWVVEKYRPNVIFHAAAHKHVPFMEDNVAEALSNNVLGTQNVLQAAEQYGVERFVLISTDKAVNPTSIMGATKRLAEMLVQAAARRSGLAFMAVRFGNVLGSRGSVIPVFQRQIAAGGPLTITHPDMYRYFMTIPEAVQLVLQSAVLGHGGEVFVLDMGQPVRILDLGTDLVKLCGLEPDRDIKIVFSGVRPGEKLSEELFLKGEEHRRTKHPKIFVANHDGVLEAEVVEQFVIELISLSERTGCRNDPDLMRELIPLSCRYIDTYQPLPHPALPGQTFTPDPLTGPASTSPISAGVSDLSWQSV